MGRTVREIQQEFAQDLGANRSIIWDLYTAEEKNGLLERLKALIPDNVINEDYVLATVLSDLPESEKNQMLEKEYERVAKENAKIDACRTELLNASWAQRKYCNGDLLTSTVFVLVTEIDNDEVLNETLSLNATKFTCHPLFRVRKCHNQNESDNCCMVFVDETARVYQDWNDYQDNNILPEGVMIAPSQGVYCFDENNQVKLTIRKTPNSTMEARTLRTIDTGAGFLGLGASLVPLSGLLLPVAAPLIVVSTGVAVATGIWSAGRSTAQLVDRGSHEQSINLTDRQARSSWLGLLGGVVGLGASGATYRLANQAAAGNNISNLAKFAVNGLNVAALVTNGLGVGNGIVELILKTSIDGEKITAIDLVQLAASLALFTHSAYNFQYASSIVNNTRDGTIQDFRSGLSKRQRKIFDKMYKETVRIKGDFHGKIDVVRALGKIPDNKYFNDIHKVNKDLNKNNIKPSFGPDGKVLLNNDISVDSLTLRNNVQHKIGDNLLNNVRPTPSASNNVGSTSSSVLNKICFNPNTAFNIIEMITKSFLNARITNISDLQNCIFNLCERIREEGVRRLIEIGEDFVRSYGVEIERKLGRFLPFELILWRAYKIAVDMCREVEISVEYLNTKAVDIIESLRNFYQNLITRNEMGTLIKCSKCCGSYSIVELS